MINIKQLVKTTLENAEILDLTGDKKVYFLHATNPKTPYIEYEIYDEFGEEWAENEEVATTYSIQVDIFSKSNYSNLEEKIKEKMIETGFGRTSGADLWEDDTQLYHKAMRFIYTK